MGVKCGDRFVSRMRCASLVIVCRGSAVEVAAEQCHQRYAVETIGHPVKESAACDVAGMYVAIALFLIDIQKCRGVKDRVA